MQHSFQPSATTPVQPEENSCGALSAYDMPGQKHNNIQRLLLVTRKTGIGAMEHYPMMYAAGGTGIHFCKVLLLLLYNCCCCCVVYVCVFFFAHTYVADFLVSQVHSWSQAVLGTCIIIIYYLQYDTAVLPRFIRYTCDIIAC